jgi:hypothetical protein
VRGPPRPVADKRGPVRRRSASRRRRGG